MNLRNRIEPVLQYIKDDYHSNHFRFFLECIAWLCSIIGSTLFAATVPTIPVVPLYSIFLIGCFAALCACWSRGSFGMVLNYSFIIVIDFVGLIRFYTQ